MVGAAAAISEVPTSLKRIFAQDKLSEDGKYDLQLYHRGRPYLVSVDDQLPLYREGTPIAMQQSESGAWWPAILEKAYAKMHQNYARLAGGLSFESLRTLTGVPVIAHLPMYFASKYNEATVAQIIDQAVKRNHIISGGIFKDYEGLAAGHTYTITGVTKVTGD